MINSTYVDMLCKAASFFKPRVAPPGMWGEITSPDEDRLLWNLIPEKLARLSEEDVIVLLYEAYMAVRNDNKQKFVYRNHAELLRNFVMLKEDGTPDDMWLPYMIEHPACGNGCKKYELDEAKLAELSPDQVIKLMNQAHMNLLDLYYNKRS